MRTQLSSFSIFVQNNSLTEQACAFDIPLPERCWEVVFLR